MTPYSFLHTGDEHIDTDTHGTINPATGLNTAWESNYRALRHLAESAVENKVDFFLSAGDNFKTGRPSQEALLLFVEALSPVAEAGIPIILLDGNHHTTGVSADHRTVIHAAAQMLTARGTTVLTASKPELLHLPGGQQIAALPWLSKNRILAELGLTELSPADADRAVADYGMATLTRFAEEADQSAGLIMASHVTVDDVRIDHVAKGLRRGSETELAHLFSEPVLPRKELDKLPFSYGALSHIHTPQKISSRYWYAGSPNRLTFTDMPDTKGGNLVRVDSDGGIEVRKIVTPARAMASFDLDIDADWDRVRDVAEGTLVQILLPIGEPEMPREIRQAITAAGATLAETKARPKPRPEVEATILPDTIDHVAALRSWAELHAPSSVDALVTAAEGLVK